MGGVVVAGNPRETREDAVGVFHGSRRKRRRRAFTEVHTRDVDLQCGRAVMISRETERRREKKMSRNVEGEEGGTPARSRSQCCGLQPPLPAVEGSVTIFWSLFLRRW